MTRRLTLLFVLCLPLYVSAQKTVTFFASDDLKITADLYLSDSGAPYIILFHGEAGSRGEYKEIAPMLLKLGFNCLAVDLRNGKESNFVQNETAARAKQSNIPATYSDCEKDISAAVDYVLKTTVNNRCILFGNSFSALPVMKIANRNPKVTAVVVFSPIYAADDPSKNIPAGFDKLLYAACSKREYPYVAELLKDVPPQNLTVFQPSSGDGMHGVQALQKANPSSDEYRLSLMMFIKKVKETKYRKP